MALSVSDDSLVLRETTTVAVCLYRCDNTYVAISLDGTMSTTPESDIKTRVRETIESLPDDATWDEVMYRLYVRQKIEAGLKDIETGNTLPVSEVRKRFGLTE